jgi:peroxiredoxin
MIVQIDTDAPDFEMQDFRDASVRLSDFKNRKNVVIVFNRGFF